MSQIIYKSIERNKCITIHFYWLYTYYTRYESMKRYLHLFLVTLLTLSMLTGCGAAKDSVKEAYSQMNSTAASPGKGQTSMGFDMNYKTEESIEMESTRVEYSTSADTKENGGTGGTDGTAENMEITLDMEKLVYRANVVIETLNYQTDYDRLKADIAELGGIIQYESESDGDYGWYYEDHRKTGGTLESYISCRIPTKHYASFMEGLGGYGKVIEKDSSVENISQRYNDTTAKIESLKIQQERLLDMLDKAVTIEEMLNIEDRLEEIRYEINGLETDVRHMDMDVAYSYVNITLREVFEYTPDEDPTKTNTFFDRLWNTTRRSGRDFLRFCEDVLFELILLAPYIVIAAIILGIVCKVKKMTLKELVKAFLNWKPKEKRKKEKEESQLK